VSRRLDGSGQGAALGSLQGLQSLGSFIGPPLAGVAYELLGQKSPFWLGTALLVAWPCWWPSSSLPSQANLIATLPA